MTSAPTNQIELIRGDVIPLEPLPPAQGFGKRQKILQREYVYSSSQLIRRYVNRAGKKQVMPYVCHEGQCVYGAGDEFWWMFCTHLMQDWRPGFGLEVEGEECALHAAATGYVAFSHPGHNHTALANQRRYSELRFKVAGIVYLADNDQVGRLKAEKCAEAAAAVGLPFVVVYAGDVLEGLPAGGSIDDVDDVGAAIKLILEAARSAQPSAQTTCAEPVQLALPNDPKDSPAQPSAQSELKQVGKGRDQFTLDQLLPKDVSESAAVLTESLPFDPLSVALPYLTGISAMVRLGTRIYSAPNFSRPPNLFVVTVAPTGSAKTDLFTAMVKAPAEKVLERQRQFFDGAHASWKTASGDDKGPEPGLVISQIEDYTPPRLDLQLEAHEKQNRGVLLLSDEIAGIFGQLANDSKAGSGRGETQLLELWDGGSHTTVRMGRATTSYKKCQVSLIGGIQPELLGNLIGESDITGRWARCLFLPLPEGIITPSDEDFTQEGLRWQELARQTLAYYAECIYDLPAHNYELSRDGRLRFNQWFVDIQHRAKRSETEPVVRSMLMKSSGQCLRVAGLLHIVNTQGKHIPISLETTELAIAIVDQLFAETEAFHLKPSGLIDRLMERIRSIAKDTKKCPNGNVSYAQNRNHLGRTLKRETNARLFNEAIGLMVANREGRLVKNDTVTWHP